MKFEVSKNLFLRNQRILKYKRKSVDFFKVLKKTMKNYITEKFKTRYQKYFL